jgi:hypothetical protein
MVRFERKVYIRGRTTPDSIGSLTDEFPLSFQPLLLRPRD